MSFGEAFSGIMWATTFLKFCGGFHVVRLFVLGMWVPCWSAGFPKRCFCCWAIIQESCGGFHVVGQKGSQEVAAPPPPPFPLLFLPHPWVSYGVETNKMKPNWFEAEKGYVAGVFCMVPGPGMQDPGNGQDEYL